jgi:hypothetical protein
LIPVDVVLNVEAPVPEVMVRALVPRLMEDVPKPERVKAPEVAVRLRAPDASVNPVSPVSDPADERIAVGVLKKFLYPVAEAKLIPVVVKLPALPPVPASKEITLTVLVPEDGVVLLVGVKSIPCRATPAPALVSVRFIE